MRTRISLKIIYLYSTFMSFHLTVISSKKIWTEELYVLVYIHIKIMAPHSRFVFKVNYNYYQNCKTVILISAEGGVVQWLACQTRNR